MLMITLAIILVSLVVQLVNGNQRIVYVSEAISESISDNEDLFTSASDASGAVIIDDAFFTSDDGNISMCCMYGNCSCNSFYHALANFTSNVMINIVTDVMLSSLINASNLENVSIMGHNNHTVNCKKSEGIHLNFCHNCIMIRDITWDGCGRKTEPGIKLRDSSNIVVEYCSFQYSKGPAIVLSGVSGHVNISHCSFVHSNHYEGHGAAIHYSSSNCLRLWFTLSNCNFTYNKHARSLVYVQNTMSESNSSIIVQDLKFYHNQGTSIYVVNQNIHLLDKFLFQNNTAKNDAGIYMKDHSTVVFAWWQNFRCSIYTEL